MFPPANQTYSKGTCAKIFSADQPLPRYYVYDSITHLIYGKTAGMVEAGHDVENLIKSWHEMFRLGGLVATLPWLIHPLINAYPFNKYLMPQKGHRSGSGHIMSVSARSVQTRRSIWRR